MISYLTGYLTASDLKKGLNLTCAVVCSLGNLNSVFLQLRFQNQEKSLRLCVIMTKHLPAATAPRIYPNSYGNVILVLLLPPPTPPLSCISTIKNSRCIHTSLYFKHLSKAGLHSHVSLPLTALAGYSSTLPGKKAQMFCADPLPRVNLALSASLFLLFSPCLPCLYLFITFGLRYSGGQLITLVPSSLKIYDSCVVLSASQLLIFLLTLTLLFCASHSSSLVLISPVIFF